LLLRQIRDLERLVAELAQEISRRYAALDKYLRTGPGLGAATAPAI
jgi:transposase